MDFKGLMLQRQILLWNIFNTINDLYTHYCECQLNFLSGLVGLLHVFVHAHTRNSPVGCN